MRRAEAETSPAASAKAPPQKSSLLAARDAAVDAWFIKAYLKCWSPPAPLPPGEKYSARIRITHIMLDGSLDGPPRLVNPPSDPAWRPYAESALRAVKKCNPLKVRAIPGEVRPVAQDDARFRARQRTETRRAARADRRRSSSL